ncbi:MAG: alpha/beta fold hydrolase [Verrucomicrobiales bacterium]
MDSPATWAPLINTLRADPEIRRRYQFWFYSYPSGYPYPHSAAILRHQLDAVQARFPMKKKMVVIGHSMGGLVSRLLITDSGDRVWDSLFDQPPEAIRMSEETRDLLTDATIFKRRPEVGRVIFIASPHRGSDLATNWVGRIGSSLVRAPEKLAQASVEIGGVLSHDPRSLGLRRLPNSVDTLSPKNRFVRAIDTIPVTDAGVPFHSIIGDRGKGGNPDQTKPLSSDGVVPYWSSHLDGAQSELVVPSGHGAHQHPAAIAEVRRILVEAR